MRPSDLHIKKLHHFTGHTGAVYAIEEGPETHTIFTGAGDGVIALWRTDADQPASGIARVPGNIFSLELIADHNFLICGDMKGGIYVINLATREVIKNLSRNDASVFDLHYSELTKELFAASGDGHIHVWQLPDFIYKKPVRIASQSIRNIAVSPDHNTFVFAASDHNLYVTDSELRIQNILTGHTNSVFCSSFTNDGNILLSGSRDARLRSWDAENSFRALKAIDAHMFTINDIKCSPGGKLFATAGRDKHIKIWETDTLSLLKVIDVEKFGGHINSVNKLFWSGSDNCLISCGDDRAVMVWEISTKNQQSGN